MMAFPEGHSWKTNSHTRSKNADDCLLGNFAYTQKMKSILLFLKIEKTCMCKFRDELGTAPLVEWSRVSPLTGSNSMWACDRDANGLGLGDDFQLNWRSSFLYKLQDVSQDSRNITENVMIKKFQIPAILSRKHLTSCFLSSCNVTPRSYCDV